MRRAICVAIILAAEPLTGSAIGQGPTVPLQRLPATDPVATTQPDVYKAAPVRASDPRGALLLASKQGSATDVENLPPPQANLMPDRVPLGAGFVRIQQSFTGQVSVVGEQGINHQARIMPRVGAVPDPAVARLSAGANPDLSLSAGYSGRAAAVEDSTRLVGGAAAGFLPSTIPVAGQQFFGSRAQAALQGDGSVVNFNATKSAASGTGSPLDPNLNLFISFLAPNSNSDTGEARGGLQQTFLQYNYWVVGQSDTAFADNDALPETLDFSGPNARVTVLSGGAQGKGNGRLSRYFFSNGQSPGFRGNLSLEAPLPEIKSAITSTPPANPPIGSTSPFASTPDFISTLRYSDGDGPEGNYIERWHVQVGSIVRSLGLEKDNNTAQYCFGWGTSLSGVFRFHANSRLLVRDGVFFSATYGQGISHYIMDLQTTSMNLKNGGNDAILNPSNTLVPLPALAWYTGYTHNWSDNWRSTATYSHVSLGSPSSLGANAVPFLYRFGDYLAINLLHHLEIPGAKDSNGNSTYHTWFYGLEYLYGQKETLNGALGHDDRIEFVMAFSK
jgi:hypothetical protein